MVKCLVTLLDKSEIEFQIHQHENGRKLFDKVCKFLNLAEIGYFGLIFRVNGLQDDIWLRLDKSFKKQFEISPTSANLKFSFSVQYYPSDPSYLKEELTKYQICLQTRDDLLKGRLPCPVASLSLLASYWLQSEFGDQKESEINEVKNCLALLESACRGDKEEDFQEKTIKIYKSRHGMPPADADTQFLRLASKLALYGVHRYGTVDEKTQGKPDGLILGIGLHGVMEIVNNKDTNIFRWRNIKNVNYKKNKFFLKLLPTSPKKKSIEKSYHMASETTAHAIWRNVVDHHVFFRVTGSDTTSQRGSTSSMPTSPKHLATKRKGSFRFSFRKKKVKTEEDIREESSKLSRNHPKVVRKSSLRHTASLKSENLPTSSQSSTKQPTIVTLRDPDTKQPIIQEVPVIIIGDMGSSGSPILGKSSLLLTETIMEEDESQISPVQEESIEILLHSNTAPSILISEDEQANFLDEDILPPPPDVVVETCEEDKPKPGQNKLLVSGKPTEIEPTWHLVPPLVSQSTREAIVILLEEETESESSKSESSQGAREVLVILGGSEVKRKSLDGVLDAKTATSFEESHFDDDVTPVKSTGTYHDVTASQPTLSDDDVTAIQPTLTDDDVKPISQTNDDVTLIELTKSSADGVKLTSQTSDKDDVTIDIPLNTSVNVESSVVLENELSYSSNDVTTNDKLSPLTNEVVPLTNNNATAISINSSTESLTSNNFPKKVIKNEPVKVEIENQSLNSAEITDNSVPKPEPTSLALKESPVSDKNPIVAITPVSIEDQPIKYESTTLYGEPLTLRNKALEPEITTDNMEIKPVLIENVSGENIQSITTEIKTPILESGEENASDNEDISLAPENANHANTCDITIDVMANNDFLPDDRKGLPTSFYAKSEFSDVILSENSLIDYNSVDQENNSYSSRDTVTLENETITKDIPANPETHQTAETDIVSSPETEQTSINNDLTSKENSKADVNEDNLLSPSEHSDSGRAVENTLTNFETKPQLVNNNLETDDNEHGVVNVNILNSSNGYLDTEPSVEDTISIPETEPTPVNNNLTSNANDEAVINVTNLCPPIESYIEADGSEKTKFDQNQVQEVPILVVDGKIDDNNDSDTEYDRKTIGAMSALAVLGDDDVTLDDVTMSLPLRLSSKEDIFSNSDSTFEDHSDTSSFSDVTNNTEKLCNPNILDILWAKISGLDDSTNAYERIFKVKRRKNPGRQGKTNNINSEYYPKNNVSIATQFPSPASSVSEVEKKSSKKFIPSWPFNPESVAGKAQLDELDREAISAAMKAHVVLQSSDNEDLPDDVSEDLTEIDGGKVKTEKNKNLTLQATCPAIVPKLDIKDHQNNNDVFLPTPPAYDQVVSKPTNTVKNNVKNEKVLVKPRYERVPSIPMFAKSVALYHLGSSVSESGSISRQSSSESDQDSQKPLSPNSVEVESLKYPPTIKKFKLPNSPRSELLEYDKGIETTDSPQNRDSFKIESTDSDGSSPKSMSSSGSSKSSFPRFVHSIFPLRKFSWASSTSSKKSKNKLKIAKKRQASKKSKKSKKNLTSLLSSGPKVEKVKSDTTKVVYASTEENTTINGVPTERDSPTEKTNVSKGTKTYPLVQPLHDDTPDLYDSSTWEDSTSNKSEMTDVESLDEIILSDADEVHNSNPNSSNSQESD